MLVYHWIVVLCSCAVQDGIASSIYTITLLNHFSKCWIILTFRFMLIGTSNTVKKSVLGGHHLIIGTIHVRNLNFFLNVFNFFFILANMIEITIINTLLQISPYIIIERFGTHIRHVNGHVHQIIEWVAKRHNFT
jgi:hypothetical protein